MATIVCVVGDKGGTGKSTWARALADLYRHARCPVALFDGDWLARSLFKFYRGTDAQGKPTSLDRQDPRRGCILYDARDRRYGRDLLLNSMAFPGVDVILHDLPAGFRTDIAGLMSVPKPADAVKEFAACAAAMGHRLVLVNVMTPSPSDYHTAPWLAETVGDGATVIAVRNGLFDSSSFGVWQREASKGFVAAGGVELDMPKLDAEAAILCDQRMVRFTTAVGDDRLPLADRLRVLSWIRRFAESVAPVAETLHLPVDVAERIAGLRVEAPPAETAVVEPPAPENAEAPPAAAKPEPSVASVAAPQPPESESEPAEQTAPPEARPAPRPRSPAGRRPLSEFIARAASGITGAAGNGSAGNGATGNGDAAGPKGGKGSAKADERFLLTSDTPIM